MDRVTVFSSRTDRCDLRRGDHIYAWRKGLAYTYAHHGIYESDKKVIHFTSTSASSTAVPSSSSVPPQACTDCAAAMRKGGVVICCLNCFLEGNNLCLFVYSVSWLFYQTVATFQVVQDTCSMEPEDPPETVLQRANDLLAHGFGSYHLALKNCFDFAFYCKTGRRYVTVLDLVKPSSISKQDLRSAIRRWFF